MAETWPEVIEFASNTIKMIDRYKMMIQRSLFVFSSSKPQ